jgi:hypothetical protein
VIYGVCKIDGREKVGKVRVKEGEMREDGRVPGGGEKR